MMLFAALVELVGIGVIPGFVAIVAAPETALEFEIMQPVLSLFNISTAEDILIFGATVLIAVFLLKNIYLIFYHYIMTKFIYNRFVIIGSNLFKKYMLAPYEFHLTQNTAVLLRNVTQEALHLSSQVMLPLLKLMMETVLVIAIFISLLLIEPIITIGIFFLIGSGGILFLRLIKEKTSRYGDIAQQDRGLMIKAVNEGNVLKCL